MPLVDYQALLFTPIYATLGTPAALTVLGTRYDGLTVIDKTTGIEVTDGPTGVQTILPGCFARIAELDAKGINREALDGATWEFNGKEFRINSYMPRPTLAGERAGELIFLLSEIGDADSESESASESESESAT